MSANGRVCVIVRSSLCECRYEGEMRSRWSNPAALIADALQVEANRPVEAEVEDLHPGTYDRIVAGV
jgi:hypothetical protein